MGLMWTKGWGGKHAGKLYYVSRDAFRALLTVPQRWWCCCRQERTSSRSFPLLSRQIQLLPLSNEPNAFEFTTHFPGTEHQRQMFRCLGLSTTWPLTTDYDMTLGSAINWALEDKLRYPCHRLNNGMIAIPHALTFASFTPWSRKLSCYL